ncbi:hypothetical protein LguiA_032967 [Lonicera macranthoides]
MSYLLPLGFKFLPTDNQLITYLIHKIRDEPLPCEGIISETDVFGERPPSELFGGSDRHGGDVRYFFTLLKKKTENSTKNYMKRNVGDIGTWHADSKGVRIRDPQTQKVIGNRKAFNFKFKATSMSGPSNGDDSRWLMTEYSLDGVSLKYKKPGPDYVLCRIKKKNLFQKQQQQQQEDCDSGIEDNAAADVVSGPPPTTFIPPTGSYNVSYRPQAAEYCVINNCSNGLLQNHHQVILPDSSAAQAIGEEDCLFDDYIDVSQLIGSEQPSTGVEDFNLDESNLEGFGGELRPPFGNEENVNNYNLGSLLNGDGDGHAVHNIGASSWDRFSFEDTIVYVDPLW